MAALASQAARHAVPVLIVDSGSDEDSADALRRIAQANAGHYLRCDEPGLSRARNAAVIATRSRWIAFLDDDARPHPDWMDELMAALGQAADSVAILGGRVRPVYPPGESADHVTRTWALLLSCVDAQDGGDVLRDGVNVCGANLAVRRDALETVGGFPTSLGRTGESLLSGEEAYLIERLDQLGFRTLYEPRFVVGHRIPRERLQPEWARRRAFWEGASRVQIALELGDGVPRDLGPLKLTASLPVLRALSAVSRNVDWSLRYNRALGALYWHLKRRTAGRRAPARADALTSAPGLTPRSVGAVARESATEGEEVVPCPHRQPEDHDQPLEADDAGVTACDTERR
jgi:GT2 family glycosyltransferase